MFVCVLIAYSKDAHGSKKKVTESVAIFFLIV